MGPHAEMKDWLDVNFCDPSQCSNDSVLRITCDDHEYFVHKAIARARCPKLLERDFHPAVEKVDESADAGSEPSVSRPATVNVNDFFQQHVEIFINFLHTGRYENQVANLMSLGRDHPVRASMEIPDSPEDSKTQGEGRWTNILHGGLEEAIHVNAIANWYHFEELIHAANDAVRRIVFARCDYITKLLPSYYMGMTTLFGGGDEEILGIFAHGVVMDIEMFLESGRIRDVVAERGLSIRVISALADLKDLEGL